MRLNDDLYIPATTCHHLTKPHLYTQKAAHTKFCADIFDFHEYDGLRKTAQEQWDCVLIISTSKKSYSWNSLSLILLPQ